MAALLDGVGVKLSVRELDDDDVAAQFAAVLGLDGDTFDERCRAAFDESLKADLERRNAAAWRTTLVPVLVALAAEATALDSDLRDAARVISEAAPAAGTPGDLVDWVNDVIPPVFAAVSETLQSRLRAAGYEDQPDGVELDGLIASVGRSSMLDRVRAALARTPGRRPGRRLLLGGRAALCLGSQPAGRPRLRVRPTLLRLSGVDENPAPGVR